MTSLLTIGTFDLFHSGHVEFLQKCKMIAEHVTVGVNPDEFVAEFKREPVMTAEERTRVLQACRYVDHVMRGTGADSKLLIEAWMRTVNSPRILAIGADWARKDYLGQLGIDEEFIRRYGLILVYLHSTDNLHSTELIERCRRLRLP